MNHSLLRPPVALSFCLVFAGFCMVTPAARAALTITAVETGGDVVFTFSGDLDTTGAVAGAVFNSETDLNPGAGNIENWTVMQGSVYLQLQSAVSFGTGVGLFDMGTAFGDNFALFGSDLNLPDTYVSGTAFNAMLTFTGETFASLGVNEAGGPYVWTLMVSGDTITMRFPQFEAEAAAAAAATAALRLSLEDKIKKLKKKAKKLKKRGQKVKAKKILKKVKKLKKQLAALE